MLWTKVNGVWSSEPEIIAGAGAASSESNDPPGPFPARIITQCTFLENPSAFQSKMRGCDTYVVACGQDIKSKPWLCMWSLKRPHFTDELAEPDRREQLLATHKRSHAEFSLATSSKSAGCIRHAVFDAKTTPLQIVFCLDGDTCLYVENLELPPASTSGAEGAVLGEGVIGSHRESVNYCDVSGNYALSCSDDGTVRWARSS
eukprot:SAG11_NODE_238_length_11818_cov_2.367693_3_plen_203_part_00